ncbi:hypothetical protein HHK36_019271 [Tetracentron sinense]|uniref:Fructose-bisphosphate aldolase n=1 Tax=Tetracentron sinense TaxID=13715 RepID=A0A835DC31_TETSI|nr:hypothetical protein HHK36_019271 [Tetracentron sinense]
MFPLENYWEYGDRGTRGLLGIGDLVSSLFINGWSLTSWKTSIEEFLGEQFRLHELVRNASYIATQGKGVLLTDESTSTIGKCEDVDEYNRQLGEVEWSVESEKVSIVTPSSLAMKVAPNVVLSTLLGCGNKLCLYIAIADELVRNASYNATQGKGVLLADESTGTIGKCEDVDEYNR